MLVTGLTHGAPYFYDVESTTGTGAASRDSLGGAHRNFTTKAPGDIALVMDDPSPTVAATWTNALQALGWNVDVIAGSAVDPPLVGNASAGLRRYNAVLWQVDPNRYPAFSDAQRMAIDSLLNGGGRLLVTGHDIGFSLADAGAPSYSLEREAWLESGLKSRYYYDCTAPTRSSGRRRRPDFGPVDGRRTVQAVSLPGRWRHGRPGAGHQRGRRVDPLVPGDHGPPPAPMGLRWESNTAQGVAGTGVWGGQKSRLVAMFFEWRALVDHGRHQLRVRTAVLERRVAWLLERRPPLVTLKSPPPDTRRDRRLPRRSATRSSPTRAAPSPSRSLD